MNDTKPRIFLNYRAGDQGITALLLDRELSLRYGPDQVFLDNRSLVAGRVFDTRMMAALRGCSVLVSVIGRSWLTLTDDRGRRLLGRRNDWVRMEIADCLARGVPVLPVLVDDVAPLVPAALPPSIRALARYQFVRLRQRSFHSDLEFLVAQLRALDPVLTGAAARSP